MQRLWSCGLVLLMAGMGGAINSSVVAAEDAIVAKPTATVTKGPLVSSVTVKGTLEVEGGAELKVQPKQWANPLMVEAVVPHGTPVKRGTPVLKFVTDKLELQIRELKEDREAALIGLELAERELIALRQTTPIDLETATRNKKQTYEDLQFFLKEDKQQEVEQMQLSLKSSEFSLESAREELNQLEKMYKDKDLTEETEQMILRRYQMALISAEASHKQFLKSFDRFFAVNLPRKEEAMKINSRSVDLALERAQAELPLRLKQKELSLEKMRHDERRSKDRLQELEHDLAQMTCVAPQDGVAYYGRYVRGQWVSQPATLYAVNGVLPPVEVLMTIVPHGKCTLFAEVEEKPFGEVKVGQSAMVTPTASRTDRFLAKVAGLSVVPLAGKYDVRLEIPGPLPANLVPGMTASAAIVTGDKPGALSLPSKVVFDDEVRGEHYVYLAGDEPKKQVVEIGIVTADRTEITKGLAVGDQVLVEKPAD